MEQTIRLANSADIDAIFDIRTSVVQNHLSREQLSDLGITPATLAAAMNKTPCCWIAQVGGAPAGFALIDDEEGEVFALFVRSEHEGKGIGQALLKAAEDALFQRHEVIFLITDGGEEIRANGFYTRNDWILTGTIDERDVRYEKRRPLLPALVDNPRW